MSNIKRSLKIIMRNILGSLFGSLFVFLFAPMLPAQAQFGDLLKKLEQEVKKGVPSQPSQGGGGEKSSQNNIQVMDGVDSNILDKVTPSFTAGCLMVSVVENLVTWLERMNLML